VLLCPRAIPFENDFLRLIFNATAIANVADNAATAPLTSLYVSLHTADPGEAGDQTTGEAAYTGYARVAVARTSGGWAVTADSVSPVAAVVFPACTGGSATVTYFGVGTAASGAGKLLYSGPLGSAQGAFTAKASTDTVSAPSGSFAVNDPISFQPLRGFALPGGITAGTVYFVKTVSGTDVTISTTAGGATLDVTTDGAGSCFKGTQMSVTVGVTPQLSTATAITED
jgi:hypothetical protein